MNIIIYKDWTLKYIRHSLASLYEGKLDAHLCEETISLKQENNISYWNSLH
jgi:hypothetical protein